MILDLRIMHSNDVNEEDRNEHCQQYRMDLRRLYAPYVEPQANKANGNVKCLSWYLVFVYLRTCNQLQRL